MHLRILQGTHFKTGCSVITETFPHISVYSSAYSYAFPTYISVCYSNCTNPECLVIARAEQSGLSRGFNHLQRVDDPHVTRQFSDLLHGLDVPHLGIQSANNLSACTYISIKYLCRKSYLQMQAGQAPSTV